MATPQADVKQLSIDIPSYVDAAKTPSGNYNFRGFFYTKVPMLKGLFEEEASVLSPKDARFVLSKLRGQAFGQVPEDDPGICYLQDKTLTELRSFISNCPAAEFASIFRRQAARPAPVTKVTPGGYPPLTNSPSELSFAPSLPSADGPSPKPPADGAGTEQKPACLKFGDSTLSISNASDFSEAKDQLTSLGPHHEVNSPVGLCDVSRKPSDSLTNNPRGHSTSVSQTQTQTHSDRSQSANTLAEEAKLLHRTRRRGSSSLAASKSREPPPRPVMENLPSIGMKVDWECKAMVYDPPDSEMNGVKCGFHNDRSPLVCEKCNTNRMQSRVDDAHSPDSPTHKRNIMENDTNEDPDPWPPTMKVLKAMPGNNKCLECDNPPAWVELRHATFLCAVCIQAYRNRADLFKVKNANDFDTVKDEERIRLAVGGNIRCLDIQREAGLDDMQAVLEKGMPDKYKKEGVGVRLEDVLSARYETELMTIYRGILDKMEADAELANRETRQQKLDRYVNQFRINIRSKLSAQHNIKDGFNTPADKQGGSLFGGYKTRKLVLKLQTETPCLEWYDGNTLKNAAKLCNIIGVTRVSKNKSHPYEFLLLRKEPARAETLFGWKDAAKRTYHEWWKIIQYIATLNHKGQLKLVG